jgi:putative hydrolase of the HAD superfamily
MVGTMSNQPIKAVLLDYGGVIAEEGFRGELVAMAREQGLDPKAVLEVAKYAVYDSGFVLGSGTEEAFWTSMREGSGLRGNDTELTARVLDAFILRPWIIEQVRQWRSQGYITGILSDQMHWLDWLNERDRFFDAFDHVFNSYHMGKGKRDPTLFDDLAEQLALPPAGILLVDDLRSNVERAQAAGWQAVLYVDKTSFEEISAMLPEKEPDTCSD